MFQRAGNLICTTIGKRNCCFVLKLTNPMASIDNSVLNSSKKETRVQSTAIDIPHFAHRELNLDLLKPNYHGINNRGLDSILDKRTYTRQKIQIKTFGTNRPTNREPPASIDRKWDDDYFPQGDAYEEEIVDDTVSERKSRDVDDDDKLAIMIKLHLGEPDCGEGGPNRPTRGPCDPPEGPCCPMGKPGYPPKPRATREPFCVKCPPKRPCNLHKCPTDTEGTCWRADCQEIAFILCSQSQRSGRLGGIHVRNYGTSGPRIIGDLRTPARFQSGKSCGEPPEEAPQCSTEKKPPAPACQKKPADTCGPSKAAKPDPCGAKKPSPCAKPQEGAKPPEVCKIPAPPCQQKPLEACKPTEPPEPKKPADSCAPDPPKEAACKSPPSPCENKPLDPCKPPAPPCEKKPADSCGAAKPPKCPDPPKPPAPPRQKKPDACKPPDPPKAAKPPETCPPTKKPKPTDTCSFAKTIKPSSCKPPAAPKPPDPPVKIVYQKCPPLPKLPKLPECVPPAPKVVIKCPPLPQCPECPSCPTEEASADTCEVPKPPCPADAAASGKTFWAKLVGIFQKRKMSTDSDDWKSRKCKTVKEICVDKPKEIERAKLEKSKACPKERMTSCYPPRTKCVDLNDMNKVVKPPEFVDEKIDYTKISCPPVKFKTPPPCPPQADAAKFKSKTCTVELPKPPSEPVALCPCPPPPKLPPGDCPCALEFRLLKPPPTPPPCPPRPLYPCPAKRIYYCPPKIAR